MNKYIDAEKLIAAIKREIELNSKNVKPGKVDYKSVYCRGAVSALYTVKNLIPSLQLEPADIDLDTLVIELEETIGTSPHSRETIKEFFQKALKSLRPQPKAEWSDEDESKKERLISIVKRALHGNKYPILNDDGATELITWLKSFRPQPILKPSKEQMEALMYATGEGGTYNKEALKSLMGDLKKRM